MNRRDFLRTALAAAAAAALPAASEPLLNGELGVYEGVRVLENGLAIALDVARGEDAAIAMIVRGHGDAREVLSVSRLERPQSQEAVTQWVRNLCDESGIRRVFVRSPRDGELEAWRNYDHMAAARRRQQRKRGEDTVAAVIVRDGGPREARELEAWRSAQEQANAQRERSSSRPPQPSRRQAIRQEMRRRMSGWGGPRGSLLDSWKRLASEPAASG